MGLASITRLGQIVILVHNPTGQGDESPLPTSVSSGYPPLVQLGVATLASNSIKLLRHPFIERSTAVTTTTTTARLASGTAQPISAVQRLAGPQQGQSLTLWLSETSLGGDESLSFVLHLVNHGTVSYDCNLLRVHVIRDGGSTQSGRTARPRTCLATPDIIPPGDQVSVPFYVSGYPFTENNKELGVMPYGATGPHVLWNLVGMQAGATGAQP